MSFLASPLIRSLRTYTPPSLAASRSFRLSTVRRALNEKDRGHDNLHVGNEQHKKDGPQKQKDGKGTWKGELASPSEAAIKADRDEAEASEEMTKEMQKQTEKLMNEKAE